MGWLHNVERGLENAVNTVFARAFRGEVEPIEIATRLTKELDAQAKLLNRDKRLVPASSKEIARFTIARAGAAAATFARDGAEGWRFEEGGGAAADATAVGSLLAQICALRADQYFAAPPADAAAGAPAEATIALFKGDGTEAARIEFAGEATPGGARYGRVGGRPGVFLANLPGLWAELQKDPASFAPEPQPAAK